MMDYLINLTNIKMMDYLLEMRDETFPKMAGRYRRKARKVSLD